MIGVAMARHARERERRAPRSADSTRGRSAFAQSEHPLEALQRLVGNRAVSELVTNQSASQHLARALVQRQPTGGDPATPGGVQNVPIGTPPPVTVSPSDLAASGASPPGNTTYTGAGSAPPTTGPAPAPTAPAAPAAATAPTAAPAAGAAAPGTTPATTTATGPAADTSTPHADPTLTIDPFNVTATLTIADLHAFRASTHLVDVDFLADPSASVSVGTDPAHAVAAGAAVNIFLVHVKQNGDSVLDLGFGPSVSTDGSTVTASGQASAELHVTEHGSVTFTATITPTPNASGGVDMNASAVVGTAWHF